MKYLMEQNFELKEVAQNEYKEKHENLLKEEVEKLYRGMSIQYLNTHFNISNTSNAFKMLYEIANKLFFIGIKSNHYLHRNSPKSTKKSMFSQLAYELQQICNSNGKYSNLSTIEFNFSDDISEEEKIIIRDYYLTFLHQLGIEEVDNDIIDVSPIISTSSNYNSAFAFTNNRAENGIIIEYAIPKQNLEYLKISFNNADNYYNRILNKYNLPIISSAPHPNECEISNRYALFPQYIVGFYFFEKGNNEPKYFVLNSFFNEKQIPFNGFNINQQNFDEQIKNTNYQRGVENINNGFTDLLPHHDEE